jgi:hypothetical protein
VADKQAAPGLPHRGRLLHRSAITRSPSLNGTDSGAGGAALSTQPRAVPGGLFVLHARSLPDNPYDGHTCGTSSTAPRRSPAVATSKAAPARPPTSCSQQWATTSAVSSTGSDNCCACSWSDYGACWPVLPRSIRLLNGRLGSALPTITQSLERSLPSSAGSLRQRLSHIGLRNAKLPRYCGRLDACFEGGTHCIQLASAQ